MLYHLLYPLRDIFFGFNVFRYITFRTAMAATTAFLISIIVGPFVIKKLRELKVGQNIRNEKEAPGIYDMHKHKQGTPTMGGVLILLAVTVSTVLWADIFNKYVILTLLSTIWLGIIGFMDDYIKLVNKKSKGLAGEAKLAGQLVLALIVGLILYWDPNVNHSLDLPFLKNTIFNMGIFYIPFVMLVLVGTSNAVNLTDGLDGLAIGCVIMIAVAYAGFSYVSGHAKFSSYLDIAYIKNAGELTVFCAALLGAGLGFLWFNSYPASVFMGDTGSLALGGALGIVSVLIKKELLLVIVGGIFVVEAVSVILQVGSFKMRKKRIFLMAPIHHHFQMKGWAEPKVIVRFWIVAAILALLSLATLKLR